jgi:hypothetical protein
MRIDTPKKATLGRARLLASATAAAAALLLLLLTETATAETVLLPLAPENGT